MRLSIHVCVLARSESTSMKTINENSIWFRICHTPSLIFGAVLLFLVVSVLILQPVLTHYDANANDFSAILQKPSRDHWLGTDSFGRDLFTRVLEGGKVSLRIGIETVIYTTFFGVLIALFSGYFEIVDVIVMRVMDVMMAFPTLLIAMVLAAVFGNSISGVTLALTIVYVPRTVRILRSSILSIREEVYVEAARSIGVPTIKIMFKHILPGVLPILIVQETFLFAYAILAEAGISFVGVGVQPPDASWGNILSDATSLLREAPWCVIAPGFAIMIMVFALNLLGDGLREVLDPKRQKGKAKN